MGGNENGFQSQKGNSMCILQRRYRFDSLLHIDLHYLQMHLLLWDILQKLHAFKSGKYV